MILAIIESKSDGMVSPTATPVSIRTPGPRRERKRSMTPGAWRETVSRIFGVQPDLDGVARQSPVA